MTLQCNWEQVLYYKYLMYNDTYIETFTVIVHAVHDLIQNQTKPKKTKCVSEAHIVGLYATYVDSMVYLWF